MSVSAQVLKTAAVPYTKGTTPYTPNTATSSEIRVDTSCSCIYWWDRDNLTWMRLRPGPDVISGSVPPAYTPHDNQSLFAVNADSELYYWDGSTWNQIGGGGAGGIYGGSGTVPDNTTATLTDELAIEGGDLTNFSVATGTTTGGALASSFTAFATSYRDTLGDTKLELNDNGAEFSFGDGSFDRLTIRDRDARYFADYSATYSPRSIPDVEYVEAMSWLDWASGFSSATQATSSWTAVNAASNVNAAIVPKGTGALTLAVPDGTTTGGNARGAEAIDLQNSRNASTQVASGTRSAILGGRRNTASGTAAVTIGGASNVASGSGAVVIGGYSGFSGGGGNTASGANATVLNGTNNTASGTNAVTMGQGCTSESVAGVATGFAGWSYIGGQLAMGNAFSELGDAQASTAVVKREITGTSQTEISNDGVSSVLILPDTNRLWNFRVDVAGFCTDAGDGVGISTGDAWSSWHVGAIKRLNTSTALVGTIQVPATAQSDASMATTVVTIDADDTNESLRIRITPPTTTGSTTVTRWVATVHLTEIGY